jgi:hypothetical protein
MSKKLIEIIFFIQALFILKLKSYELDNLNCQIKNAKFRNEYLTVQLNYSQETVPLRRNVFLKPYDSSDRNTWTFIRANTSDLNMTSEMNENEVYFIKNKETSEFLCALNRYELMLNSKHRFNLMTSSRIIYTTLKANKLMLENELRDCKWKMIKLEMILAEFDKILMRKYNILNIAHTEALYATSKNNQNGKNIFLWHSIRKRDDFKWIVKCSNDFYKD